MNSKMLVVVAALAVAGCAGLPIGRGHPEKVLSSDANTIELQWSRFEISEAAVRSRAVLHCDGRPVEEVGAASKPYSLGIMRAKTWRCVGR